MRRLDRYLAREMATPFLFGLGAFTSLFLSGDLLNLTRMAVDYGAPLLAVAKVLLLRLPQVFVWTVPMAVLLGALLSLSRLSANSEIVAMRAGGVSLWRVAGVVLAIGAAATAFTLGLSEWVAPRANERAKLLVIREIQRSALPRLTHDVILKRSGQAGLEWLLYARTFDSRAGTMSDVTLIEFAAGRPRQTVHAQRLQWDQGQGQWFMEGVTTYRYGEGDQVVVLRSQSGRQPVVVGQTPAQVAEGQKEPAQMGARELWQHIAILRQQGADVRRLWVEWHLKLAIPVASLVFALMGVPLGIQPHRSASTLGFGLSIVIIFIYYLLMSLGSALGQGGYLPAWLGAWLQNLALGAAGLVLLARTAT